MTQTVTKEVECDGDEEEENIPVQPKAAIAKDKEPLKKPAPKKDKPLQQGQGTLAGFFTKK